MSVREDNMDWTAIGLGITAGTALITGNAVVMRFVIKSAITESLLGIHERFVTKEHLDDHAKNCPHQYGK